MNAVRLRLSSARREEDGFSLMELIVAMAIFLVLATMIGGMLISTMRTTTQGRYIDTDTRNVANGMNEISRVIRSATENPLLNPATGVYPNEPAVQGADLRTITVYTYVNLASSDETPVKVMFSVNAQNQLIETKYLGTSLVSGHWTFSTTVSSTRVLCDNVATTTIFAYLADDGSTITIPTGGIVANADLRSIRSVAVSLSVKSPLSRAAAITLQNTIGMPNLGFSNTTAATP